MRRFENRLLNLKNQDDKSKRRISKKKRSISISSTGGFGSVSSLLRFDFGSAAILPLGYRRLYDRKIHFYKKKTRSFIAYSNDNFIFQLFW